LNISEYGGNFYGVSLPVAFCWTRVGSEAGQSLGSILQRKEAERASNDGLFFWGIGNAIGPSVRELLRCYPRPEVIFSPIKSRPRKEDANPRQVAVWTKAERLDGSTFELPQRALITSRFDVAAPRAVHYALVCSTNAPLTAASAGVLDVAEVENLVTGRPVGASQVTAVVRRRKREDNLSREYDVLLRAKLTPPFFLRLLDPILLPSDQTEGWEANVANVWAEVLRRPGSRDKASQRPLPLESWSPLPSPE
jgi:hypothetical protein